MVKETIATITDCWRSCQSSSGSDDRVAASRPDSRINGAQTQTVAYNMINDWPVAAAAADAAGQTSKSISSRQAASTS